MTFPIKVRYVSDKFSAVFVKNHVYTAVAIIPAAAAHEWSRFLLIGENGNFAEAYCNCFCPITKLEEHLS
jgi:hypothetical protein